jgi:hypothetical protein
MTLPFHPPDPGVPVRPNPAGLFRMLPVPPPLIGFGGPLPAVSLPLLPVVLNHVPVRGRHATQYAHCRRISGPRSRSIIRYGVATRAGNWSTKSTTTATVCSEAYFLPFLKEIKGIVFVVGVSSRGTLYSKLGGDGRMEEREVGGIFGVQRLQPQQMPLKVVVLVS